MIRHANRAQLPTLFMKQLGDLFQSIIWLYDRGAFKVWLVASFNLNVNESHLCALKRHEVTGHRFALCSLRYFLIKGSSKLDQIEASI